jgi:uncharacterized protein (AIM24 family)
MSDNTIWSPNNLPSNDNLNPYTFVIDVQGEHFIRKGKMIAYYGNLRFEALGSGLFDTLLQHWFNAPEIVRNFVVVSGQGKLLVADNENYVNSYDLDNANLTVKADNLLAFAPGLKCEACVIPDYLTLLGTGKMLASSNGQVHFMEPPVRVDEQALLGWADVPTPSYHHDYGYMRNLVGMVGGMTGLSGSGEEKQIDFTGKGTVLVQSSEDGLRGRGVLDQILAKITGLHQNQLEELRQNIQSRLSNND